MLVLSEVPRLRVFTGSHQAGCETPVGTFYVKKHEEKKRKITFHFI